MNVVFDPALQYVVYKRLVPEECVEGDGCVGHLLGVQDLYRLPHVHHHRGHNTYTEC